MLKFWVNSTGGRVSLNNTSEQGQKCGEHWRWERGQGQGYGWGGPVKTTINTKEGS